jgi:hypothetical protein
MPPENNNDNDNDSRRIVAKWRTDDATTRSLAHRHIAASHALSTP